MTTPSNGIATAVTVTINALLSTEEDSIMMYFLLPLLAQPLLRLWNFNVVKGAAVAVRWSIRIVEDTHKLFALSRIQEQQYSPLSIVFTHK